MGDEEYDLRDSEDESANCASTTLSSLQEEDQVARTLAMSRASGSELESGHSEWFKVEPDDLTIPGRVDDSETEEDNDSDNHDLKDSDVTEEEDDGWLSIPKENQTKDRANAASSSMSGIKSSGDFYLVEAPNVGFLPPVVLTKLTPSHR